MAVITKEDLNEDQKNALNYMKKFLLGPNRQMMLAGPAGTGKTSLINVLLNELDESSDWYSYTCTAPTNKAVDVIARSTNRDFDKTIYSILGLTIADFDDGKPQLIHIEGAKSHLNDYDLVVIDEASMVSSQLLDILQKEMMKHTHVKVIYVGDPCQIPPVDDANQGMLESLVFQLPLRVDLKKVMRTAEENPILGIVTSMRADMRSPVDLFEHNSAQGKDGIGVYFETREKKFMSDMMPYFTSQDYKEDTNFAMAVAYTNAAVDAINARVRANIYPGETKEYVVGEEVRVTRPYGVESSTRAMRILYTIEERLKILECEEANDPKYDIPCYKLTVINHNASKSQQVKSTAWVVRADGWTKYYMIQEQKAAEAKARLQEVNQYGRRVYTKREAWQYYSAFKHFFLFVAYVYAMTAHKAQGSTIQNVFVVERNINRITDNELRNKLKYTAFTRAAKELHVLT